MIVFTESSPHLQPSASSRDIDAATRAARLAGARVYHIPQDFSACGDADSALWHVPVQDQPEVAAWIGYIPSPERYRAIHEAAAARNIWLVNDPEQYRRAMEIDRACARLAELTPRTRMVGSVAECGALARELAFPVFVKGTVQSAKAGGWSACVADDLAGLERLVGALLKLPQRSRGQVAVRELVRLRHVRTSGLDFPLGREYRVFLYRETVLAMGYYWEGDDPLKELDAAEQSAVRALAIEAARRLAVPFLAIDIGQLDSGAWIVIESGDGQFSGASQVPLLELWHRLNQAARPAADP